MLHLQSLQTAVRLKNSASSRQINAVIGVQFDRKSLYQVRWLFEVFIGFSRFRRLPLAAIKRPSYHRLARPYWQQSAFSWRCALSSLFLRDILSGK
jgi:hypothetical protein